MSRLLLMSVVLLACATTRPPESAHRAVYVKDAATLLASASERARLDGAIRDRHVTEVVPYGVGAMLATPELRAQLDAWIVQLHTEGAQVIVPVASADRLAALIAFVAEYPAARLDGLVTEFEFWNRTDRGPALDELVALLDAMRNQHAAWARGPGRVGAYLGYPTADEAERIAGAVDFVFLDYAVTTPERAWAHVRGTSNSLRERFGWFATTGVKVWPIFYAAGEVDMQASLQVEGAGVAEQHFTSDLAHDPQLGATKVAGFVYFTFEALPDRW
jgi:hypothetical protein